MSLVGNKAAILIADVDSREQLIDEVLQLMEHEQRKKELCENIEKLAKPEATADIVNACETLLK